MHQFSLKIKLIFIFTVLFFIGLSQKNNAFAQNYSTKGTNFWLAFMDNEASESAVLSVYISADEATTGMVEVPLLGWSANFSVGDNSTEQVIISTNFAISDFSEVIEDKGIRVTSEKPVSVFALNYKDYTADAAIIYPTNLLGKDYFTLGYESLGGFGAYPSEFVIVGVEDNTEIEITPSVTTYGGKPANVPFTITLNQGQIYQIQSDGDLSGTRVRGTNNNGECQNFAVFSGAFCTNVGGCSACDHLYEQVPPINTWGREFITAPLETRNGDEFRILASENDTEVYIDGSPVTILNAGDFYSTVLYESSYIKTSEPVLLAQYSRGADCDGSQADPFMIYISPIEQTLQKVTFNAFDSDVITSYYLNLIIKSDFIENVTLDGGLIPGEFNIVAANPEYSTAQFEITQGNHTLECPDGIVAYVYGYGSYESYGYQAGANLTIINASFEITYKDSTEIYTTFDSQICVNDLVDFSAIANPAISNYTWDFGDGSDKVEGLTTNHAYAQAGTYTVKLEVQFLGACAPDVIQKQITVTNGAAISLNLQDNYCQNEPAFTLTATPNNGVFYIDNEQVTQLNPANLSIGQHTLKYIIDGTGCGGSTTQNFNVNAVPYAGNNANFQLCNATGEGQTELNLVTLISPNTVNTNGAFEPLSPNAPEVTNGSFINANGFNTGTYIYTYTVTTALCGQSEANFVIEVNDCVQCENPADATFEYAQTNACSNSSTTLTATATQPNRGTFSAQPEGLAINAQTGEINPDQSSAGTYTVTYFIPAANDCPSDEKFASVTIIAPPFAGTPQSITVCFHDEPIVQLADLLQNEAPNGSWTSTAPNFNATQATFNPNGLPENTYTFEYTVQGTAPCANASQSVTVQVTHQGEGCAQATIGDFAWIDTDANGIQNSGEPALANIEVELINEQGNVVATTQTNSQGQYLFENIAIGTYKLHFIFESCEYVPTLLNATQNETDDSDIDANGFTHFYTLEPDEINLSADAGYTQKTEYVGNSFYPLVIQNCKNSQITGFYEIYILPKNGVPPYTVSSSVYNGEITGNPLSLTLQVSVNEPFVLQITDGGGCTYTEQFTGCTTLPVEMLRFEGKIQNNGNQLYFATATETNNQQFDIYHSTTGSNFENIATLQGAGNSNIARQYAYLHPNTHAGTHYYYLTQTNYDGTTQNATPVITLTRHTTSPTFTLNTVPNQPQWIAQILMPENPVYNTTAQLHILDITGKIVEKQTVMIEKQNTTATINTQNLSNGIYFVTLTTNSNTQTIKVVK